MNEKEYPGDIVLPLENAVALDRLAESIVEKVPAMKEPSIIITLDGKEIGRVVSDQLRKMQRRENVTLNLV